MESAKQFGVLSLRIGIWACLWVALPFLIFVVWPIALVSFLQAEEEALRLAKQEERFNRFMGDRWDWPSDPQPSKDSWIDKEG